MRSTPRARAKAVTPPIAATAFFSPFVMTGFYRSRAATVYLASTRWGRRCSLAPGQRRPTWFSLAERRSGATAPAMARRRCCFVVGPASGAGSLQDGRSWFWAGGGRAKACSAPGRWSGGGSMSSGISMAVVAVDRVDGLDRRPCCSPALWAVWFPSAGKLEPSDARTREMAVWRNRELVGMA